MFLTGWEDKERYHSWMVMRCPRGGLSEIGRVALLEGPVATTSRRLLAGGVTHTQIKSTSLVGLFRLGADSRHLLLFYPDKLR